MDSSKYLILDLVEYGSIHSPQHKYNANTRGHSILYLSIQKKRDEKYVECIDFISLMSHHYINENLKKKRNYKVLW